MSDGIEIEGVDKLLARLVQKQQQMRKNVVEAVEVSQSLVVTTAKQEHPYTDRTENNTNSIQERPVREEGSEIIGEVGAGMEYSARLEFGFVGVDSLGRQYNQPALPYMRPALKKNSSRIKKLVKKAAEEAVTSG